MSSFSYNVSFNEEEVIALKDALEFYVSEEAMLQLSSKERKGAPYHYRKIKELLDKFKSYENAHFVSSKVNLTKRDSFIEEFFHDFSDVEKIDLLEDVEVKLLSKAPLNEFDGADNLQIIMSPSFQQRVLDVLIELIPTHTKFVKEIFAHNNNLFLFTKMFVNFYRDKTL